MIIPIPYSKYVDHLITQNKTIPNELTKSQLHILAVNNIQSQLIKSKSIEMIDKFSAQIQCGNISVKNLRKIGEGSYGNAYRFENYVIKVPKKPDQFAPEYATCKRTSRILNEINGHHFSRTSTLPDTGQRILITKFVDGEDAQPLEAFDFIKSHQRILHDFYVQGNVKKDKQGKLYLIDADQVTLSYQGRRNSIASEEFYEDFECFRGEELVVPKRMKSPEKYSLDRIS
ncbi:hypothetical protein [Providencia alcalifaciens]|uniref:Protein kinase domain-containing protein n=3 Tax=Morganellaceae TaxID=1903414 RepID=A0AAW9V9T7_9GAMM|nr:hypothetical protein [Providencia alcalifaciens]ETT06883.1 hypothetical protein HMPREF1562_1690 [Providencia alcalifaciens F90-2004]EUC96029.1 hypothetical protein HMPREF1567_1813 [Providencia alcalifaciens PAL-2]EUD10669.1 hypothetical protein HMPREF1563_1845 [Providencia alcalifaciens 205/92]MBF0692698.1 hypothetical protein [Providencia alcalifaciens]MTB31275.1 hypothetical protein [Providencia alcalifaciens]